MKHARAFTPDSRPNYRDRNTANKLRKYPGTTGTSSLKYIHMYTISYDVKPTRYQPSRTGGRYFDILIFPCHTTSVCMHVCTTYVTPLPLSLCFNLVGSKLVCRLPRNAPPYSRNTIVLRRMAPMPSLSLRYPGRKCNQPHFVYVCTKYEYFPRLLFIISQRVSSHWHLREHSKNRRLVVGDLRPHGGSRK